MKAIELYELAKAYDNSKKPDQVFFDYATEKAKQGIFSIRYDDLTSENIKWLENNEYNVTNDGKAIGVSWGVPNLFEDKEIKFNGFDIMDVFKTKKK